MRYVFCSLAPHRRNHALAPPHTHTFMIAGNHPCPHCGQFLLGTDSLSPYPATPPTLMSSQQVQRFRYNSKHINIWVYVFVYLCMYISVCMCQYKHIMITYILNYAMNSHTRDAVTWLHMWESSKVRCHINGCLGVTRAYYWSLSTWKISGVKGPARWALLGLFGNSNDTVIRLEESDKILPNSSWHTSVPFV